jgi:TonB family protein
MNALLSSPVLSWLLSYLFNALWQIPLIFAAAWLATRMLRRAHPGLGHRVWIGALFLQIVLPACDLRLGTLLAWLSPWFFWSQGSAANGHVRVSLGPGEAGGNLLHLPTWLLIGIALVYACTVLYFAGRLVWGLFQTHALARTAIRIPLTGALAFRWEEHCHRIGITAPPPEIAASPHAMGPVTVGLRRGLLLLPLAFLETIAPRDLDAVLAHELAHIRRRDFAKNVLYGLASLPVAWHPLLWRTRARIAESRELVCDAIAAEAVAGPRQYAQSLLRLASMLAGRPAIRTLHALGILSFNEDRNVLERRIMILTHKRTPMSTTRRFVIAAACGILVLATCTSALALHTDVSALSQGAENRAAESAAPAPIHVKASVMASQKISGENPTYPQEARAKKIQGTVELALVIDKDGLPQGIHVKQSPSELLTKSAIKAVSTWRWRPYLLNGNPIEVDTTVNVTYNLAG